MKVMKTIACCNRDHEFCPGVFREDLVQPWSNQICDCLCHLDEKKDVSA